MSGFFDDGIDGVGKSHSSFVPSRMISNMYSFTISYNEDRRRADSQVRIQNLHPHICCATHND
jgi:hypothetical protein